MRALQTCDFCGADAVGTFEIIPPELEPTDTEQRRVVLCPDCKARLEDLLGPLLARLDAGSAGEPAKTTPERTDDHAVRSMTPESAVGAAREATTVEERATATADSNESESQTPTSSNDNADDAGTHATPALESGITFDSAGTRDDGETSDPAEPTAADDSSDDTAEESVSQKQRPPAGYGKVIRLLQNREFPMARSAVEGLAAGAYDLESHEVDAIIEHALEEGEFVEEHGELRRP